MLSLISQSPIMNRLLVILLLFNLGPGCKEEKFITTSQIEGNWQVVKALRNLNPTQTFDGAYFQFENDIFQTNFQGEVLESPYILDKNVLAQTQPETLHYKLQMPHHDTLVIATELHGSQFSFTLKRIQ